MQIRPLVSILTLALLVAVQAAAAEVTINVKAGNSPRRLTPIRFAVCGDQAKPLKGANQATLQPSGALVQIHHADADTAILYWVEPDLAPNASKEHRLSLDASDARVQLTFSDAPGHRDLNPTIYRHITPTFDPANRDQTLKPFHHLYGLHGEGFLTKGHGGLETHHRGLFLGFNTQHGNFWSCKDVTQQHVAFDDSRQLTGPIVARETSTTNWIAKDGKPVVRDTRDITTWRIAPDQLILDWDITLESLTGDDIDLGGDAHHGGFHFRTAQEVAGPGKGSLRAGNATYIRPPSAKLIKDDTWSDCPWAAMLFSVQSNPYIVVHMDHPSNPKPTTYSTRPYGRFGAFFKDKLKQDQPLHLQYRIVLLDGKTHQNPTEQTLAPLYEDFVNPPAVSVGNKE